ncbi:MAG: hypothetical protein U0350_30625 [Caldilineaceae bacterium]
MKKLVNGALALLVGLGISIGANSASTYAQGAFTAYTSGVQVANLEAADAQITLSAYNPDGSKNGTDLSDTVSANGSKTYFPISNVSNGFSGSIVVSSSKKIAAISNILSSNFSAGASYVGRDAGNTTVRLPLLNKGNSGFNTWFSVQNAGTADAAITVKYSDGSPDQTATIKPGAAKVFYQAQENHPVKTFAGTVTSSQPLVAAVIQESTSVMFAYTGFTGPGSTNPVFPLINANNAGYVTGLQIQNAGTAATDVTVTYTPSGTGANPCTETQTIQPSASNTFAFLAFSTAANPTGVTSSCTKGAKFVGSAKVTGNSANQPLVGIGNQLLPGRNGEAYGSFDPTNDANNKVVMPLIMDRNGGYFTGFSVQNVGSTAATVSCTFSGGVSYSIPATTLQPGQALADLQGNKIANKYVGAATCTATDAAAKIVGVVNELGPSGTADQLLVYEAVNPK